MWKRLGANPNILGTPLRVRPDTRTSRIVIRAQPGGSRQAVRQAVSAVGRTIVERVQGRFLAGRALQGFLVGVPPDNAPTMLAVAGGLTAVARLACYFAARPATGIAPGRLLRDGG
jgi:hypothetical protein